ncbi:MAG: type III-B CRISPR module-associated protein Cmr3 [Bacteroidales bacterium]|nr:type III-B CRISPR module-associated protein Cmr3 [Bacteroidales bacterium]
MELTLEIQALDTLFFRDGKPFSMGDDSWADGVFPPAPSVVYGALRSAWALENNIPVDKIDEKTSDFEIQNIYYEHDNNIFFTLPLDLLVEKNPKQKKENKNRRKNVYSLKILDKFLKNEYTSNKFSELITYSGNEQLENLKQGIIDRDNFINYINKTILSLKAKKLTVFNEDKIGISRDKNTNNTTEGMLYRIGLLRIPSLKIYVRCKGLHFKKDIIKLGAEGKLAKIKVLPEDDTNSKKLPKLNEKLKRFKIVLISPAYFENGYLPSWISDDLIATYNGYKLKLLNAIIGKPISQGGFDMKARKPKPMVRLVPSGSVFYFEVENEINPYDIFNKLSISDNHSIINFQKQGYGHFIIAKI